MELDIFLALECFRVPQNQLGSVVAERDVLVSLPDLLPKRQKMNILHFWTKY